MLYLMEIAGTELPTKQAVIEAVEASPEQAWLLPLDGGIESSGLLSSIFGPRHRSRRRVRLYDLCEAILHARTVAKEERSDVFRAGIAWWVSDQSIVVTNRERGFFTSIVVRPDGSLIVV